MSIMDVLKKDLGGSKKPKEPKEPKGSKETKSAAAPSGPLALTASPSTAEAPAKMKGAPPALSASPRANLLPPEIGQNQRKATVRRGLRFLMLAVLVLVVAGTAGSFAVAVNSEQKLAAAEAATQTLAAERAQYDVVSQTLSSIASGTAARAIGGSPDVDWSGYLRQLQAALPVGVSLTTVVVTAGDAETPFGQSSAPLDAPRIASLNFTASTSKLPVIPEWINGLSNIPGFAGASPQSLSYDVATSTYTAVVRMDINSDALSHKYDLPTEEATK